MYVKVWFVCKLIGMRDELVVDLMYVLCVFMCVVGECVECVMESEEILLLDVCDVVLEDFFWVLDVDVLWVMREGLAAAGASSAKRGERWMFAKVM